MLVFREKVRPEPQLRRVEVSLEGEEPITFLVKASVLEAQLDAFNAKKLHGVTGMRVVEKLSVRDPRRFVADSLTTLPYVDAIALLTAAIAPEPTKEPTT